MSKPAHRLALVTGTSSGIGEVLARQLLEHDWNVVGIARKPVPWSAPRYRHLQIDLSSTASLTATLDKQLRAAVSDPAVSRIALINNAADVALLGTVDQLDPGGMLRAYAVNTVAPVLLMGWVLHSSAPGIPIRIVNVSSGAAVEAFPGLGAYGATKAALRLAGMIFAAELDARDAAGGPTRDVTVWSYEPGIVDTPMQDAVRGSSVEKLPIVGFFHQVKADGQLLGPDVPAKAIVQHIEADGHPRFSEQRFQL